MARFRLCRACRGFHLVDAWPQDCATENLARSELPGPAVRVDEISPLRSMADGRLYDSKSAYYASVRRAGCQIVGDDRSGFGRPRADELLPPNIGADIRRSIEALRQR